MNHLSWRKENPCPLNRSCRLKKGTATESEQSMTHDETIPERQKSQNGLAGFDSSLLDNFHGNTWWLSKILSDGKVWEQIFLTHCMLPNFKKHTDPEHLNPLLHLYTCVQKSPRQKPLRLFHHYENYHNLQDSCYKNNMSRWLHKWILEYFTTWTSLTT